jgi:hypothetical protein
MAETKNTFTGSKMNQDLDARLLPNGQYRTAQNVAISKSEDADVGALENILGNISVSTFSAPNLGWDACEAGMEIIGKYMDSINNRIFVFLTNYVDTSDDKLSNPIRQTLQAYAWCQIGVYDITTKTSSIIVGGVTSTSWTTGPGFNSDGGGWLNFSQTHPIIGINLIEDLLFWTDNRNQPRKININTAIADPNYYRNEDHVSVAKYYPYKSLELYEDSGVTAELELIQPDPGPATGYTTGTISVSLPGGLIVDILAVGGVPTVAIINTLGTGVTNGAEYLLIQGGSSNDVKIRINTLHSTMKDVASKYLPAHAVSGGAPAAGPNDYVDINTNTPGSLTNYRHNIHIGDRLSGDDFPDKECVVVNITYHGAAPATTYTRVFFETDGVPGPTRAITGVPVFFQRRNPYWQGDWSATPHAPDWPGDPNFLKDKFVRFSYRFKFDDGEYSLIAPFTQPAFVPKQDGYFIGKDTDDTYRSTIVRFMENKINDIDIIIPAPDGLDESPILFDQLNYQLKVTEIDILYKESDGKSIKLLDTVKQSKFSNWGSVDYGIYNYQSRAPHKTLPSKEISRVWDKVPVRALAQETSGNRIIYGNFLDKYTSPPDLNYTVLTRAKTKLHEYWDTTDSEVKTIYSGIRKEYQNHTLKQNRSYQVGIVLVDRWGRQSDVILSNIRATGDSTNKGSTIYHPYRDIDSFPLMIAADTLDVNTSWDTWPGDALNISFKEIIPPTISESGYPGLFREGEIKIEQRTNIGFGYTVPTTAGTTALTGTGSGMTVRILSVNPTFGTINDMEIMRPGAGYNSGDEIRVNIGTIKQTFIIGVGVGNRSGWYSYKVVVKQLEQEYYNVFLPGILNAYPDVAGKPDGVVWPTNEDGKTAHISMFSDNVNKVPRNLQEVGPEQKQFNSSVKLYGRVQNAPMPASTPITNTQCFPGREADSVDIIGSMVELKMGHVGPGVGDIPPIEFYNGSTNPLIARISTKKAIGETDTEWAATTSAGGPDYSLAVYETAPVESKIDIFWETSTSGLISDLNWNIQNIDSDAPFNISIPNMNWTEATTHGTVISTSFVPVNGIGADLYGTTTLTLDSVLDVNGVNVLGPTSNPNFILVDSGSSYTIQLSSTASPLRYFMHWVQQDKNRFTFNFTITRTSTNDTLPVQFETAVANAAPFMDCDITSDNCAGLKTTITNTDRVLCPGVEMFPTLHPGKYYPNPIHGGSGGIWAKSPGGTILGLTKAAGTGYEWNGKWNGVNGSLGPILPSEELVFTVTKAIQLGVYGKVESTPIGSSWEFFEFGASVSPSYTPHAGQNFFPWVTGAPQLIQGKQGPTGPIIVNYNIAPNGKAYPDGVFAGLEWWWYDSTFQGWGANGLGRDPADLNTAGTNNQDNFMMFEGVTDYSGANGTRTQGFIKIPYGFPCGKYDIDFRVRDVNNTGLSFNCTGIRVNIVPTFHIKNSYLP